MAPTTDHSLRRRIDFLERELAALRRLVESSQRQPRLRPTREVYLAKTIGRAVEGACGEDETDYPAPPSDKFRIAFVDDWYDRSDTGVETSHAELRINEDQYPVAYNSSGCYPPEGTLCTVVRYRGQRGADRGIWWITKLHLKQLLIIKTPSAGIDGRDENDVPGFATCDVGRIVNEGTESAPAWRVETVGRTETIFNISFAAVAGSRWGTAKREAESGRLVIDLESCGDP